MHDEQGASSKASHRLGSDIKEYILGTHRTVRPEDTLAAIAPLAKAMGITRVANITGLDVIGIPVVAVMRPNSRSVSVAQGKGLDLTSAKVSGLMESIENFHAERIRAPLELASWEDLRKRVPVVDLTGMPRAAGGAFDPKARILWIPGHDAVAGRSTWVPFEVVHTDYTLPLHATSGAFLMSDSGVASGNHPLEAISHAVCELIERDAVTLWHCLSPMQRRASRVVLDTIDDDCCASLLDSFAGAGVQVAVWEVTSDVGLPAFLCTIVDRDASRWRRIPPASGTGCHPARAVALSRALTEAAQTRLTVIAGSRDDIGLGVYRRAEDGEAATAALVLMAEKPQRAFASAPDRATSTLGQDVSWELDCLQNVGINEVVIVDLTLPEYGIPVVRVVIPGLEGMSNAAGYLPGKRFRSRCA